MVIETKNVKYGVLKNINMRIACGDFLLIKGKEASGKTTLIKLISSLAVPEEGEVLFDGQKVKKNKALGKVGVLFQNPENQLFAETVLKDVMFGPLNLGQSKEEAKQSAVKALRELNMDEQYDNISPFELSSGQRCLVALAGVLAMNVEVLILDDVFMYLDYQTGKNLLQILSALNKEGKTIILVCEDDELIRPFVKTVACLDSGSLVFFGKKEDEEESDGQDFN